ncbi:MAG: PEP-CTERM sorting domain-containing protein [Phycisphaeraceae bacterium]|nr:PEP-CTERM sorting domain-containing protein [Phycisphaeraceae bacterium]
MPVNRLSLRTFAAAILVAGALTFAAPLAHATILNFEITPNVNNQSFEGVHAGYGDNVNSLSTPGGGGSTYNYLQGNAFTPNLVVDYSHSTGAGLGHLTYKQSPVWPDLLDYLDLKDGYSFYWTFSSAGNAYGAKVNSFLVETFSSYGGGGPATVNWWLRANSTGGTVLYSGTLSNLPIYSDVTVNTGMTGFHYGGPLVLEVNFSGTNNWGAIGIDDLNFDENPVPEPASLFILGLGAAASLKRRRR